MTKKVEKNLQDSEKDRIFAAELSNTPKKIYGVTNFEMVFEKGSKDVVEAFVPGEAMSIRDMLIRTERGQRLNVHTRFRAEGIPDNMYMAKYDKDGKMLPDPEEDTFAHTPPEGMNDVVDVLRFQEELSERKEALKQRRKTVANASKSAPTEKVEDESKKSPAQQEEGQA